MEHLMWDRWDLLPGSTRQCGKQALHPTTGASDDIWCTIGIRGKWDYGRGNGIDSLLDRFTDPHWIEYRGKGCKTHHMWGELHTAWNNLFGLGNPHTSLFWFTCNPTPQPPTHSLTPHPSSWKRAWEVVFCYSCDSGISSFHQFVKSLHRAVLGLWSISCLQ